MKTCKNCYWYGNCPEQGSRCEDYTPVYGEEQIAIREYEADLRMRAEEYNELVEEQQS